MAASHRGTLTETGEKRVRPMKENANRSRGPVIALLVLAAAAGLCLAFWLARRPEANEGAKVLAVQVVHGDGSMRDFAIRTDADYLAQALLEYEPLGVQGDDGPFGLYIQTVDGETASDTEQTFWSISKDGAALTTGASGQPVADGEHYELTLAAW